MGRLYLLPLFKRRTACIAVRADGYGSDCRASRFRRWISLLVFAFIFTCLASVGEDEQSAAFSTKIDIRSEDLLTQPPAANWTSYNGDYSGRRYSALSGINSGNIAALQAQWVFHASNTKRLEVTPLVVNGMMLLTAANDAIALDARTGRVVWRHPWPISEGLIDDASGHINRGVAIWHDRVYMETDNAHLFVSMPARVTSSGMWPMPTGTKTTAPRARRSS